jgi:hypothetical protein
MIKIFTLSLFTLFSLNSCAALHSANKFTLKSRDHKANISGFITYPDNLSSNVPLVIMVPGSGLFDSEVHFGRSKTKRDLIFLDIEKELLNLGYAVLRMSYRGIFCNLMNFPSKSSTGKPKEQIEIYMKECISSNIRGEVTPENMRDDFEQVYEWALKQKRISSSKVVMFGHSEGTTHISRLIEQNRIHPHSLIFMGGVTESLDSLIKWQLVERVSNAIILMDSDKNGVITNEEVKIAHSTSMISVLPIAGLLSPSGSWTSESIKNLLVSQYEKIKANALAHEDLEPYPNQSLPQASYRWWKMFFTSDTSIIEALSKFQGQIYYHNGSIDSQTNAQRQEAFLNSYSGVRPPNMSFKIHTNRGHTLGKDPLWGPIAHDSMTTLLKDFKKVLISIEKK